MSLENPSVGARTYTLDKVVESLDSENYENWAYPSQSSLAPSEPLKEAVEESTAPSEPQEDAKEELRESTEQEILAPPIPKCKSQQNMDGLG